MSRLSPSPSTSRIISEESSSSENVSDFKSAEPKFCDHDTGLSLSNLDEEYEQRELLINNIGSKRNQSLKLCLLDSAELKSAIDKFQEADEAFRSHANEQFSEEPDTSYTYFIIDTTLFHHCLQRLPDDVGEKKLFELFVVWCLGIFYVGKGTGDRYLQQLLNGARLIDVSEFLSSFRFCYFLAFW